MSRQRLGRSWAVALLLSGCATFDPPPAPPAAPPMTPRPVRVARPRTAEPLPVPDSPPTGQVQPPAPVAGAVAAPANPQADFWHVAADRTTGCAMPEAVRMLRSSEGLAEAQPALAAQTRRVGGCATTFRVSEWTLLRRDGDLVLLRLANPPPGIAPLELFFLRRDVVAPAGEEP